MEGAFYTASNYEKLFFSHFREESQAIFTSIKDIEPLYRIMVANQQENKELVKLRDWLLPMLMNGQVTVEERATGN